MKKEVNLVKETKALESKVLQDRIEGNLIILNGEGDFPKEVLILNSRGMKKEYRIVKTRHGGFVLN